MEKTVLKVRFRDNRGKAHAKRLRKRGFVPAVIYGPHLEKNISLEIEASKLHKFLSSISETQRIMTLKIEGKDTEDEKEVIIKDTQYNWMKGKLEHVDFYAITRGELISTRVPLHLVGESPGAKKGGVVEQLVREIEVECFPESIPAHIDIDLKGLEIGNFVRVKDIQIPPGVEVLENLEEIVVSILAPIGEEELERLEEEKGVTAEEVELVEKERKERKEEVEVEEEK